MEKENNISIDTDSTVDSIELTQTDDTSTDKKKTVGAVLEDSKQGFKKLKKGTKIAITITATGILLSIFFTVGYGLKNRYDILFSDLDDIDATTITQILEEQGVEMKIEGDSIYVKSKEVDELRLKLSSQISNGSVGFEIMDDGSGFGMTEDEFKIKKLRMIQGEIERTIKSFPQVADVRVHITPGEESVFAKESKPGSSAVYLTLKPGQQLKQSQVMSIISLVSASSPSIPKQNVEVIDQNMTLLSEGMFDEEGNFVESKMKNSDGLEVARDAEKKFNDDIEESLLKILVPLFGDGNVKIAVNTDLNFDSAEKSELVFDPNNVIKEQTLSENSSLGNVQTGSPVDNNMSNTVEANGEEESSKDSHTIYEVGKTETHTIVAPGEIRKITTSIALDGVTDPNTLEDVQELVETAIGLNANRGDKVTVMSAKFDDSEEQKKAQEEREKKEAMIKKAIGIGGGAVGIIALALILASAYKKKKKNDDEFYDEFDDVGDVLMAEEIINKAITEANNAESQESFLGQSSTATHALEEEIRGFAGNNPEQATELIKIWLNE